MEVSGCWPGVSTMNTSLQCSVADLIPPALFIPEHPSQPPARLCPTSPCIPGELRQELATPGVHVGDTFSQTWAGGRACLLLAGYDWHPLPKSNIYNCPSLIGLI